MTNYDWIGAMGSVQEWECDHNNHLNVRFYGKAFSDSLRYIERKLKIPHSLVWEVAIVRFHKELRSFMPWQVNCKWIEKPQPLQSVSQPSTVQLLLEITSFGELSATALIDVDVLEPITIKHIKSKMPSLDQVPELAQARGSSKTFLPDWTQAEAEETGATLITREPVQDWEFFEGRQKLESIMARLSNGVPHMFSEGADVDLAKGHKSDRGGAVLEYRLIARHTLPNSIGPVVSAYASLVEVKRSVYRWAHWQFEVGGRALASSEAVVVPLDLKARKALKLSDNEIARMQSFIKPGFTA